MTLQFFLKFHKTNQNLSISQEHSQCLFAWTVLTQPCIYRVTPKIYRVYISVHSIIWTKLIDTALDCKMQIFLLIMACVQVTAFDGLDTLGDLPGQVTVSQVIPGRDRRVQCANKTTFINKYHPHGTCPHEPIQCASINAAGRPSECKGARSKSKICFIYEKVNCKRRLKSYFI